MGGVTHRHDNMVEMKRVSVLILLLVTALQAVAQPQFTLKVGVDLVNVLFTVTDRKGRLVTGLSKEDFAVEEDGKKQEIQHFTRENELPLTIAMLVDTSPSVRPVFDSPSVRPVFDDEKVTATDFFQSILTRKDLALLINFDRSVTLVQDFTDSPAVLKDAIESLQIGGGTSLYDAVYLAAEEKLREEAGRKAIILISDGEDTTSKTKLHEALVATHRSDAVVYSISNSPRSARLFGAQGGGDPGTLKKLSEETGGAVFFVENRNDFSKVFDQIAQELRTQYSLAYLSSNSNKDGKYRRINIVPKDPSYKVRARKGYYAAKGSDTQ
jgi:VWFA-related protein